MRYIATLATCAALGANATSATTDFSDLWYNANEEGWGMNIIQQNDIQFITLFVYGPSGQPTWYVGSDVRYTGQDSNGIIGFSGQLYATTGPYFGSPVFNESNVTLRSVGGIAFAASEVGAAVVSYTVDGTSVTKSVRRQTWKLENLAGSYMGATVGTYSGCSTGANGYLETPVTLTVTHSGGSAISIREQGSNFSCDYTGTYTQEGRMGRITGTGTCSDGTTQSFVANEVQLNITSLAFRFDSSFSGICRFSGRMAGVRRSN